MTELGCGPLEYYVKRWAAQPITNFTFRSCTPRTRPLDTAMRDLEFLKLKKLFFFVLHNITYSDFYNIAL